MGDVVNLVDSMASTQSEASGVDAQALSELAGAERQLAHQARRAIAKSSKVQGVTKLSLARNLGKILERFGRELSRDELVRVALGTDNIKPSERLGRYQVIPGKEVSESKARILSKNPAQYLDLAETAAKLTAEFEDQFVLDLVEGTKFDPRLSGEELSDNQPVEQLTDIIRAHSKLVGAKCRVAEYIELLRRYGVSPARNNQGEYTFRVWSNDHADEPNPMVHVSSIPLFSILMGAGTCEWKSAEGKWIRRPIEFEERVHYGIYVAENRGPFGAFSVRPSLFLPRYQLEKLHEEPCGRFPQSLDRPWITGTGIGSLLCGVNEDGDVDLHALERYSSGEKLNVARLPIDHGIDLSHFNDTWNSRLRQNESGNRTSDPYQRNIGFYSPIIEHVSIGSISKWLDQPVTNIRRRRGDAFAFYEEGPFQILSRETGPGAAKFDATRGLSPPDSIMAEVEVSLYYDGFQGQFGESNYELTAEHPTYDYDDEGNTIYMSETVDITYVDSFLEQIENDVAMQISGFANWLNETREETHKNSKKLLKNIDEQLRQLDAREKQGEEK
jgi:hypothetical protein